MGKQEHGDIEMIVCINRLKQFGIFSDFNGTKIQKFGRYNLVYGWNGTGKSTLSNLFSCFELRSMVRFSGPLFSSSGGWLNDHGIHTPRHPN
jgi:wobble nucleotide-excising tRNase